MTSEIMKSRAPEETPALRSQRNRSLAIGLALGGLAVLFYAVTVVKFLVMLGH